MRKVNKISGFKQLLLHQKAPKHTGATPIIRTKKASQTRSFFYLIQYVIKNRNPIWPKS
jgi:hypothetical protein